MYASFALRKRRRPMLACFECRRRKIRCDRKHPCGPCVKSNCSTCAFREDATGTRPSNWGERTLGIDVAVQPSSPTGNHGAKYTAPLLSPPDQSDVLAKASISSSSPAESNGPRKAAAPSSKIPTAALEIPITEIKADNSQPLSGTISKTRVFGRSHWMNVLNEVGYSSPL